MHQVAKKQPNGYGLYDMSWNVWEWYWDLHSGKTYYSKRLDPTGIDFISQIRPNRSWRGGGINTTCKKYEDFTTRIFSSIIVRTTAVVVPVYAWCASSDCTSVTAFITTGRLKVSV